MHHSFALRIVALLLLTGAAGSFACGGAGKIGDPCTTEGDTSECESGAVCAKNESTVIQCLTICTDKIQCASTEDCNGVTGSSLKACRPKDATSGAGGKKP